MKSLIGPLVVFSIVIILIIYVIGSAQITERNFLQLKEEVKKFPQTKQLFIEYLSNDNIISNREQNLIYQKMRKEKLQIQTQEIIKELKAQ